MSEGWPQHMHNAMSALAGGLVRTSGDLAAVDGTSIAEQEEVWRRESYRDLISRDMRAASFLVAAVMAGLPEEGGVDGGEIIDAMERLSEENEAKSSRWRLPRGMKAYEFFEHMVRRGAFHLDLNGEDYICPIPSLRSHLVSRGPVVEPTSAREPSEERKEDDGDDGMSGGPRHSRRPPPE